jgi:hypothetical protein
LSVPHLARLAPAFETTALPAHPQAEELQRLGLDPSRAYMLESAEVAEAKHKKSVRSWRRGSLHLPAPLPLPAPLRDVAPSRPAAHRPCRFFQRRPQIAPLPITRVCLCNFDSPRQEKKETPFGWDSFNAKALYNAYSKRADKIPVRASARRRCVCYR